jgi:hypothetical protein
MQAPSAGIAGCFDGLVVQAPTSHRLSGRPKQDLVDVDSVGLVHREGDHAGEGVCPDSDLAHELLRLGLDVLLAGMLEELGVDGSGRDHRRADVVGLHFPPQTLGQGAHRELGGAIDRRTRIDHVAVDGRDVYDVPDLCSCMCGSAAAMP